MNLNAILVGAMSEFDLEHTPRLLYTVCSADYKIWKTMEVTIDMYIRCILGFHVYIESR